MNDGLSNALNVCCEAATGENETKSKEVCECLNECEVTTYSTAISSGKLSPNVILEGIPDSSDIPDRFIAALETRQRVVGPLMMTTMRRLKAAIKAHKQMRFLINTEIIDVRTSWATALSKLFTSLGDMVRGHIDDSLTLLDVLNDVYLKHVDYLVTGLSSSLERLDSESAEAHYMINIMATWWMDTSSLVEQLESLQDRNGYAWNMAQRFDDILHAEALRSPLRWFFFPDPFCVDDCSSALSAVTESLERQSDWLTEYIPQLRDNATSNVTSHEIS